MSKQRPFLQRSMVIFLSLLFIIPLISAWYLYTHHDEWTIKTKNRGQLLNPLLRLENFPLYVAENNTRADVKKLHKKWQLIYLDPSDCQHDCKKNLHKMRQVWMALGKHRDRVSGLLITTMRAQEISTQYPGLLHLWSTKKSLADFLEKTPQGAFYLMDPLGYVMMVYPPDVTHQNLYDDFMRLLNISKVG